MLHAAPARPHIDQLVSQVGPLPSWDKQRLHTCFVGRMPKATLSQYWLSAELHLQDRLPALLKGTSSAYSLSHN